MSKFHAISKIAVSLFTMVLFSSSVAAQEESANAEQKFSASIRDQGNFIIQIGDFDKVESDISNLLNDVGMEGFSSYANQLLPPNDLGINAKAGLTIYSPDGNSMFSGNESVLQFAVSDRQKLLETFDLDVFELVLRNWRDVSYVQSDLKIFVWPWGNDAEVAFTEKLLFVGEDSDFSNDLLNAELLAPRLQPQVADILDHSGISVMTLSAEELGVNELEVKDLLSDLEIDLSENEKQWLKDCVEVIRKMDLGVVGLQYHSDPAKALEIRSFAQVKSEVNFGELIDLKKANEAWTADLGFEARDLIVSASFKMDTFTSSAAPRLIPQMAADTLSGTNLSFLKGGMVRVLISLCGDSWNELTAARVALYDSPDARKTGQFSVIGVVDAKDPQAVLDELQQISMLTSPMQLEERKFQRNEEIKNLLNQLQSEDLTESDRAYTRLLLVGEPARDQVTELRDSTKNNRVKQRLIRILNSYDRQVKRSHGVADAMFWTTLTPGLEFKLNASKLGEHTVHQIQITPDPTKTEEEVTQATQMMVGLFGPKWNEIQVVQVDQHFVFMLGSDQERLKRIVNATGQGKGELSEQLKDVGFSKKRSTMQVWLNSARVAELTSQYSYGLWRDDKITELMSKDRRLSWVGVNLRKHGLGVDAQIPIGQVIPFVFGMR